MPGKSSGTDYQATGHSPNPYDPDDILINAPVGIFTSTPEGRFLSVNPAMSRMYGYGSPQDMIDSVTDISRQIYVNPADRFKLYQTLEHTETAINFESQHKRKDGSKFWTMNSVRAVRNEEDEVLHIHGFITDISLQVEARDAQKKHSLQSSGQSILNWADKEEITLGNVIDRAAIQQLMTDFHSLTGIGGALLDLHGNVLASTGWQDICFKFHRAHPETNRNCMESDRELTTKVQPGQYKIYRCKNSMLDIVMPIMVEGIHAGNLFTGQFFFTDEPPDYDVFRNQARQYGFDEEEYLAALEKVPLLDKEVVTRALGFHVRLAEMISTMGYNNVILERNLAERQQLLDSLRSSEEMFRSISENIFALIAIINLEGQYTYCNASYSSILGYDPATLVGTSCFSIVHQDSREKAQNIFLQGIANKNIDSEFILKLKAKDGGVRWVDHRASMLLDDQGNPRSILILAQDVTERLQAEKALLESREKALSANKAKSEFLANMSHEIRTPINGIMGMMQLMQTTTELDAEQKHMVELSLTSARRLTRLLSDILDLSRVEAGKMTVHEELFRISELTDSVTELFRVTVKEKGITLSCSSDPDMPDVVMGDPARIRQILFNLVGNALKYTDHGEVSLDMSPLPSINDEDMRILFTISDTGIGIPDDKLKTLFEPFVQVDGSYTRKYQGAGLGLAIVKRLVDLIGGNISFTSKVGKGTTFYVVLPFMLPRVTSGPALKNTDPLTKSDRSLHILLAEDDPTNQYPTQKILEKMGHKVTLAENGRQALDLFKELDFDCILMDIQMPVMDGLEATRRIRQMMNDKASTMKNADNADASASNSLPVRIPIIALTAYAMSGDREKYLEAGMDDYLAKPVGIEDLKQTIDKCTKFNVIVT